MNDIIAGRPVFGGPLQPGVFDCATVGAPISLAAASTNTTSMLALDDFITIGTQMKIERPWKSVRHHACDEAEGPWVVLEDGRFLRIDEPSHYASLRNQVKQVWDNGELVIGYGEFMENNKRLVPAGYTMDWWASDMLDNPVTEEDVDHFLTLVNQERNAWPQGVRERPQRRQKIQTHSFGFAGPGMNNSAIRRWIGPRHLPSQDGGQPRFHPRTIPGSKTANRMDASCAHPA